MVKKRDIAIPQEEIERAIVVVRGQRVMLDFELATLYGVPTHRLNEQVRRNRDRFPVDFAFQLTRQEVRDLISQNAISKTGARGGRQKLPWVFTEHGVAMLSSVLRSHRAVAVNIEIIRAFIRMRKLFATPGDITDQVARLGDAVRVHDREIRNIIHVLQELLQPPEPPAKPPRRIGFKSPHEMDGRLLPYLPERTNR